jgi:hypothetical protein
MAAAIISQLFRTKLYTVTRQRSSLEPMLSSSVA